MDKEGRAQILRECYYANRSRRLIVARIPKPQEPATKGWRNWSTNFVPFGDIARESSAKWIEIPNPKKRIVPRTKRNAGVPVLTLIAQKAAPKKLKRAFATAEGLLSEREQQSRL